MKTPVLVEQKFNVPSKEVWEAITVLDKMHTWYFNNIPAFKTEVGFETAFLIENEGRSFTHLWKITEVIPFKKITYEWRFNEYPSVLGTVSFEIFEEKKGTNLRVTNYGIETFPRDVPEFTRESCQAGWEYFINQNLKKFLDA